MAYQVAESPMTLSDLQGHSPITRLFKWDFSYSCAAIDKISTDIMRPSAINKLVFDFLLFPVAE